MFYDVITFPYEGHWVLDLTGEHLPQSLALTEGVPIDPLPDSIDVKIVEARKPMDFSFTPMGVPIVSARAASMLKEVAPADVQFIPARIPEASSQYWVVNVQTRLDCLHRGMQETMSVRGLAVPRYKIDPLRVSGHSVFRLVERAEDLIITEAVFQAIRQKNLIGPGVFQMEGDYDHLMPGFSPD